MEAPAIDISTFDSKAGDVIVVRVDETIDQVTLTQIGLGVRNALTEANREPSKVLLLWPGITVEALDEDKMRTFGWVRAADPASIVTREPTKTLRRAGGLAPAVTGEDVLRKTRGDG